MPCYDSRDRAGPGYTDLRNVEKRINTLEAMLCALMRALEANGQLKATISEADEQASGVTQKQMLRWFAEHKERDAREALRRGGSTR